MLVNTQGTGRHETRLRTTYFMMIAFILLFCIVGWTVISSENYSVPTIEPVVIYLFSFLGFITLGLSFLLRSRLLGGPRRETLLSGSSYSSHSTPSMDTVGYSEPRIDTVVLRRFHRAHLIILILCTSTPMYGLVITLFTGNPVIQWVMSGLSIFALLFHIPRRGDLLQMQRAHGGLQQGR